MIFPQWKWKVEGLRWWKRISLIWVQTCQLMVKLFVKLIAVLPRHLKRLSPLRMLIVSNRTLSAHTKRTAYNAVVVSILLYGAETWTLKAPDVHRLTFFYNHCVRTTLGVMVNEQLASQQQSARFGILLIVFWSRGSGG